MSDQDPTTPLPLVGGGDEPPGEPPGGLDDGVGAEGEEPGGPGGPGRTALIIGLIVLIALLLGLSVYFLTRSSDDGTSTASTSTSSSPTTSTSTSTSTTTPSTSTTTANTATTTTTGPLVLSSTGIGVASFNDGQSATVSATSSELGAPTEEGPVSDCPAGIDYQARWRTFFTTFTGGSFVGWEYRGAPSGLATTEGISVGSTIGDALAVWPGLTVEESTLGPEWSAPFSDDTSINGLATGLTADATITEMWAGTICIFR
jgi:hypothetical protein